MAIYAFDGTLNEPGADYGMVTNVLKFFDAYGKAYQGPKESNFYVAGVGTRYSVIGMLVGGAVGAGGHTRVEEAMDRLAANLDAGDTDIDVVGFSRGAALALEFVNDIADSEKLRAKNVTVRFLGLWDTVASFGVPGNNVNLGYTLTVPPVVDACRHAIALDERRATFPLTRMVQDEFSSGKRVDIREVWFRGYHSDIGGGNDNRGLSDIALSWMFAQARMLRVPLDPDLVAKAASGRDPNAQPRTSGMDRIPNKKRTIQRTDQVHESVIWMVTADRLEANNPPRGLAVVDDAGEETGKFA